MCDVCGLHAKKVIAIAKGGVPRVYLCTEMRTERTALTPSCSLAVGWVLTVCSYDIALCSYVRN